MEPKYYSVAQLEQFACALLCASGLPDADAALVAEVLVAADLEGVETHGLGRLPNYVARLRKGLVNPTPQIRVLRSKGATALLDADNAMGQIATVRAMEQAIALAGTFGTGWVAVRGSSHFGAAAYYCRMATAAGMIGMVFSNTPPGMAPHGGREPFLGTNPLGIGVPMGADPPMILDMATSAIARGQILKAQRTGTPIPPDVAIDAVGAPTTDAAAALSGALLPMAGAKGYGLALGIELLTGVLAGAAVARELPSFFDDWTTPTNVGHLVGVLDVGAFRDLAAFEARAGQLAHDLRTVPPAVGHAGVRIPGEQRARTSATRRAQGIGLAETTLTQLNTLAAELGLAAL
jgi:LDH2 family malate/lactate/ureidoglycolate dehydrogenase